MPTLTISHPQDGASVPRGEPLTVTGMATDRGGAEPVMIDSVTVQVDDASPVRATLQHHHDPNATVVSFASTVTVTGAEGAHGITVVATNDSGQTRAETVSVYLGPSLDIGAPVIRLELQTPVAVDPDDPLVVNFESSVQKALVSAAPTLLSVNKILAGPNAVSGSDDSGAPVLRIGLWLESSGIAVEPPAPPEFPLPRLADATAQAGFALVPVAAMPRRTGFFDAPFALSIDRSALQDMVDAALSASGGNQIDSISIGMDPPATVTTEVDATGADGLVPVTATISETLFTAPAAGSPPVDGPFVTHTVSTSVGDLPDWLVGTLTVVLDLVLLMGWQEFSRQADAAAQGGSVVSSLAPLLPTSIPFHNVDAPRLARGFDFPVVVANWQAFEVTLAAVHGAGDAVVMPRDESMVAIAIGGPDFVLVPPGEPLANEVLTIDLFNLAPDDQTLTWQLWSSIENTTTTRTLTIGEYAPSVSLDVDFPMPLHAAAGDYRYVVTVSGHETCGTDAGKVLTGTASKTITVRKPASKDPVPGQPGEPATPEPASSEAPRRSPS